MTHFDSDGDNTSNYLTRHEALSMLETAETQMTQKNETVFLNQKGDTLEGDLDMNSNKLKNAVLENCTCADNTLVSKSYLDTRLAGLDAIYVNESGDTMDGELKMSRNKLTGIPNPTEESDAANKKYVDDQVVRQSNINLGISSHLQLKTSEAKLLKPINADSNGITNLPPPINSGDVVNKDYVDSRTQIIPLRISVRNINSTFKTILLKDINIPTIQNVDQVYVTATLHLSRFMAYMVIEKTITGPRGGPNKLTLKFVLTTLPQAGHSVLGDVVIEGIIFVSKEVTTVGTIEFEDLTRSLPETSYTLTEEARRALN